MFIKLQVLVNVSDLTIFIDNSIRYAVFIKQKLAKGRNHEQNIPKVSFSYRFVIFTNGCQFSNDLEYFVQVVASFFASMYVCCVLGGDLSNFNVHFVAIVLVVGLWGLILGAQLFSLALYLVVLTFF